MNSEYNTNKEPPLFAFFRDLSSLENLKDDREYHAAGCITPINLRIGNQKNDN
jgi:hypothetical protein